MSARLLTLRRLAVTLLVPSALLLLGDRVLLPGVPADLLERLRVAPATLGVFALGIMPVLSAYWFVELVALVVPAWSPLRHSVTGRARLERWVRATVVVLVPLQAFGVAMSLKAIAEQSGEMTISVPLVMASLAGGVCVQVVAAALVSRAGTMNGLVAISGATALREIVERALKHYASVAPELRDVLLSIAGAVVVVVATWAALRGAGEIPRTGEPAEALGGPYREARRLAVRPWIPIPSGSFQAYGASTSLLVFPATLVGLGAPLGAVVAFLQDDRAYRATLLVLTCAVALAFSLLMHRPREVADLASRLGAPDRAELARQAHAALRRSWAPSLLFFVAVILGSGVSWLGAAALTLVTAVVMDLAQAVREGARGDLVVVWEERRASAVPVLRAALSADGVESAVRGAAFLSYLQVFAPYAPAQLLVRREDEERALRTLRPLLGEVATTSSVPEARPPCPAPEGSWSPARRMLALAVAAGAACVLAFVPRASPRDPNLSRARLEIVRVDDSIDPFAGLREDDLPELGGIRLLSRRLPPSPGREDARASWALIEPLEGEALPATRARFEQWLATRKLPPGARFGFSRSTELAEDGKTEVVTGVNEVLLTGTPILTNADVTDAEAYADTQVYVRVTLSPSASERFAAATRDWRGRRIAIVLDGWVETAPIVKSEITGGKVSITVGPGEPEVQMRRAKELAARLRP